MDYTFWGMLIIGLIAFVWGFCSGYILGVIESPKNYDKWVMPDPAEEESLRGK